MRRLLLVASVGAAACGNPNQQQLADNAASSISEIARFGR
jgi:hypothetical protein